MDPTHFTSIGWLLLALAGLAYALNQGAGFLDRLKQKPSPQEVANDAAGKFTPRETADEIKQRIAVMEQLRESDQRDASLSRKNIYDEMRKMEDRVDAAIKGVAGDMLEMERRLDTKDEERTSKLHTSLNAIASELAEMRGALRAENHAHRP